jgi:hypothetical protein
VPCHTYRGLCNLQTRGSSRPIPPPAHHALFFFFEFVTAASKCTVQDRMLLTG